MKKGVRSIFSAGKRGPGKRGLTPFFLPFFLTLLVSACASSPAIKHQVLTPPPSSPRTEFGIEKVDVQSRETGEDAWARNERYGRWLADSLRAALAGHGKTVAVPPADTIRARVYLAYGAAAVKSRDGKRAKPYVEVRLQLVEAGSGVVRYSTHTQAPIPSSALARFGWAPDDDEIIRQVLDKAAQDFVSRL